MITGSLVTSTVPSNARTASGSRRTRADYGPVTNKVWSSPVWIISPMSFADLGDELAGEKQGVTQFAAGPHRLTRWRGFLAGWLARCRVAIPVEIALFTIGAAVFVLSAPSYDATNTSGIVICLQAALVSAGTTARGMWLRRRRTARA